MDLHFNFNSPGCLFGWTNGTQKEKGTNTKQKDNESDPFWIDLNLSAKIACSCIGKVVTAKDILRVTATQKDKDLREAKTNHVRSHFGGGGGGSQSCTAEG